MSKKSKQKNNLLEDELLNKYIEENKNIKLNTNLSTPFADKLNDVKKQQLKLKLKNAINKKNKSMFQPTKEIIKEQTENIKNLMKHPKMTQQILELYAKAAGADLTKTLPTPIEIFDNPDKYKKLYYQYILELLNKIKEDNLDISYLDKLLDNPYGYYITKCLDCPLNPFKK